MKKRFLTVLSISALLVGASFALTKKNEQFQKVEAYDINTKLPTTINLNDATESQIRTYYLGLSSLDESERKGNNLLKNLKPIISNGQLYYSYDNNTSKKNIWKMYEIVDRDWQKSPASDIEGYNSSTNEIVGYSYNSSDPYIHALYVNRDYKEGNQTTAWSDHNQTQWGINQEHIWAKSHGFDGAAEGSSGGARGDIMHLWAGNGKVNGEYHSNYFYGYVDKNESYDDPVKKYNYTNLSGNLLGKSVTIPDSSFDVFEPQDSDKGDIARAVFYMAARYNNIAGDDTVDGNNPDLRVVDEAQQNQKGYTSDSNTIGKMGILSDLLEWNRLDPPDEFEIHRNNLCYNNYTKNRNPFIDFPQWAEYIWGKDNTTSADPTVDNINTFESSETIHVSGISMDTSNLSIEVDESTKLTYTITPSNATNKSVSWTSSDSTVVSVSGGTITGLKEGSATITAASNDDNTKSTTCVVTVTAKSEEPENIKTITVNYNDTFDPALITSSSTALNEVTTHNDTTADIELAMQGVHYSGSTNSMIFNSSKGFLYNTNNLGTIKSVTARYVSGTSDSSQIGARFGSSQQSVRTTSGNDTVDSTNMFDKWENSTAGYGYFQLSVNNSNCRVAQIEIKYTNDLQSISVTGQTTEVTQFGDYEFDGTVTAHFDNGAEKDVTADVSVTSIDTETCGEKLVTVSYTEDGITKTFEYNVTVNEYKAVEDITVTPTIVTLDLNGQKTVQMDSNVTTVGTGVANTVTWNTSNDSVATVSSSGLVTAKAVGMTTITATSTYDITKFAECSITVIDSSVGGDTATDTLVKSTTGVSGTAYTSWDSKKIISDAIYAGKSAGGNDSIQLRSSGNDCGVVSTTSGGTIGSVSVVWTEATDNARVLSVYGSNTAFTSAADLYNSSATLLGTIAKSSGTSLEITGSYAYVGVRSSSGALYLKELSFTWNSGETPEPGPEPVSNEPLFAKAPYYNGVGYKLYLEEKGFFDGGTGSQSYFGSTSESYVEGVVVYFEQNGDGQNLYFYTDGYNKTGKKYINIDAVISGTKTYINFIIGETALNYWEVDSNGDIYVTVKGLQYSLGLRTDQDYTTFSAQLLSNLKRKVKLIDTAETFSKYVIDKIGCDSKGVVAPNFADGYSWADLKTIYNNLFNEVAAYSEQAILKNGDADKDSSDIIEQALAKYEYLVAKYGYEDFLERNVQPLSNSLDNIIDNNGSMIAIIVIAGVLVTLSTGLFISVKRRKED